MTVAELVLDDWATRPVGKAARIAIAVGGMVTATLVLLMAGMVPRGSWALVLGGVTLAATSVRAALYPTVLRLSAVVFNMIAIPLLVQLI